MVRAATTTVLFLSGLAAVVLFGSVGAGHAAANECTPFPKVPWWGELSHQSVGQLVKRRHDGDWAAYIRLWERNLSKLREIRGNQSRAVVSSPGLKTQRKILGGAELDTYIQNIQTRITVMRCLAKQGEAKIEKPVPTDRTTNLRQQSAAAGKQLAGALGCPSCHGINGTSTFPRFPNLAGQSELYLIKQLKEFQTRPGGKGAHPATARRQSGSMTARAEKLSEDDIWNLSAHFAHLPACQTVTRYPQTPPRPEIAARCVECHGIEGNGVFPEVPNLAGQHKRYLANQLKAFRKAGQGKNKEGKSGVRYHFFMSPLAKGLSDTDLDRLADYFSKAGCSGL
ncbi:MAG: cytochrome c4 [Rhodospirillales bacterium]|nr:cytochrome c4 [Rhodospirillales bacterium]